MIHPAPSKTTPARHTWACILALSVLLTGCVTSHPAPGATGPSVLGDGHAVREVIVTLDRILIPGEAIAACEELDVPARLGERVRAGVPSADDGDTIVHVVIRFMRLRNASSAVFGGGFSGDDVLSARVRVLRDGSEVKSFKAGVTSKLGGYFFAGREGRLERMIEKVAERIGESI